MRTHCSKTITEESRCKGIGFISSDKDNPNSKLRSTYPSYIQVPLKGKKIFEIRSHILKTMCKVKRFFKIPAMLLFSKKHSPTVNWWHCYRICFESMWIYCLFDTDASSCMWKFKIFHRLCMNSTELGFTVSRKKRYVTLSTNVIP